MTLGKALVSLARKHGPSVLETACGQVMRADARHVGVVAVNYLCMAAKEGTPRPAFEFAFAALQDDLIGMHAV